MANYPRGSEWRRWDLHVHTKSSYDYSYNATDADEKLADAITATGLAAVAITDHFVIDKDRIAHLRTLAPKVVFFPGVELRTDKGDTNIHIILIFDPEIDLSILAESFNVFKREKGKEPNDNAKIYWDYKDILDFAARHKALISIHAGSKTNGVDDRITNRLEHNQAVKEEYAKTVHIFEMGKPEDITGYKEHVFPTIGKRPLVICSDNHDPRSYNPTNKLWIKADPTFNGLKQILYEPEERVCISETIPDYKPDYQVIDNVTFINPSFSAEPIVLNDKLVCFIGGKSTGKSIWLFNTARVIDPDQVHKKTKEMNPPLNASLQVDQLQIHWRGEESGLDTKHKIVYIPQTYLNRLSGDQGGEKTEIDNMIQDVILQSGNLLAAYKKAESLIGEHKVTIDKAIYDLVKTQSDIAEVLSQQAELGSKTGIEAEIKKLTSQKDRLAKEASISDEDLRAYDDAVRQIDILSKHIQTMDDEILFIDGITSLVRETVLSFSCSETTKTLLNQAIQSAIKKANESWAADKAQILETIRVEKRRCEDTKVVHEHKRDELSSKVESNKAIALLTVQIRGEEKKLAEYKELESKQVKLEAQRTVLKEQLLDGVIHYKIIRQFFADEVNKASDDQTENDLDFKALVPFRNSALLQAVQSVVHNGNLRACLRDFTEDTITEERFHVCLPDLVEKILTGETKLKNGNTAETALRTILADWYNTTFSVKMDGDEIITMSPGKKALVLLKLLIGMAESKCPILIDQPEDDLDNRSVFRELIPYIQKKKKERQIIIVTHNANVVLGADADQVIVANQNGKDTPNETYKFEYLSGSIEDDCAEDEHSAYILPKRGIQQHICDILEGGEDAFRLRRNKYRLG